MLEVYTDGSCYYKDRIGGWAFVVVEDGEIIYEDLDSVTDTTTARMEMTAVMKAMEYMDNTYSGAKYMIVTDYQTMTNCFDKMWWRRWIETEWYAVKNTDIWKPIIESYQSRKNRVKFKWVRGHIGIEFNERADDLAGIARKFQIELESDD